MSETQNSGAAGQTPPTGQPGKEARQVVVQKIYVQDASLEVPLAPQIFARQWQPKMDVQVNTGVKAVDEANFVVTVSLTVTAKLGDDVAFLAEAHQAGVFTVTGFASDAEKQAVLGGYCPGMVFPFARETIADLVQRGGFPQVLLQPINFEALYLQHLNQQKAQAAATASAEQTSGQSA